MAKIVIMLRQIKRKLFPIASQRKILTLKKLGLLNVGSNCNIEGINITIDPEVYGNGRIEIGNDCYLMCNIVMHSQNATIKIGNRVFIGPDTTLFCRDSITIDDDTMISWGCTLIDTNAHSLKSSERLNDVVDWKKGAQNKNWSVVESKNILVNKKCWIGFNSIVVKGVTLEEGTVVASGSVVTKSTKPYTVVGGNPAVFIKTTE